MSGRIGDGSLGAAAPELGETIVDVVRSVFLRHGEREIAQRHAEVLLPRLTSYIYRHLGDPDLTRPASRTRTSCRCGRCTASGRRTG